VFNIKKRTAYEKYIFKQHLEPYLFLSPFLICFVVFLLWPIIFTFWVSFTDWTGVKPGQFVGITNYIQILGSPTFHKAFTNTLAYTVIAGFGLLILGFIIAYLLNLAFLKGKSIFRVIFFLPVAMPAIIMGSVFLVIYDHRFGALNYFIQLLGITPLNWLGDAAVSKIAVSIAFVWNQLGLVMMYFIAGLQSIDMSLYESAKIDGTNEIQMLWYITIPQLRHVMVFVGVFVTVAVFQIFQEPYILFSAQSLGATGGPEDSALSLLQYMHRLGFNYQNMGEASVVAVVIFLLILIVSVFQLRLTVSAEK
jgi:ABC-type sugar transport system permease subunit